MKDFYNEQNENFHHEQMNYLIRILNLFENISNTTENNFFQQKNSSFDDIKNEFEKRINIFLNYHKTLLIKNSKDKNKIIINEFSIYILPIFQQIHSSLISCKFIKIS